MGSYYCFILYVQPTDSETDIRWSIKVSCYFSDQPPDIGMLLVEC